MLLWLGTAQASSCCLPATSAAPGVLTPAEGAGAAVGLGWDEKLGAWAWDGRFADAEDKQVWTARVAAMVRLAGPLQAAVDLPLSVRHHDVADVHEVGGGVGDLGLSLRLDGAGSGSGLPRPALTVGASFPTGRGWEATATRTGVDVTGAGAVVVRGGASLEPELPFGAATLGLAVDLPTNLPTSVMLTPAAGLSWRLGGRADLRAGVAAEVLPATTTPSVVPLASLGAVIRASKQVRLLPSVSVAPPVAHLGVNGESWLRAGLSAVVAAPPRLRVQESPT